MSRYYVVLCEDLMAQVFIRRALRSVGVGAHDIRLLRYAGQPASGTSEDGFRVYACGAQHVRENFAAQLGAIRSRAAKRTSALVVHIDVDNTTPNGRSVADRRNELHGVCNPAVVPPPASGDPVALLIARRAIETWIEALMNGTAVNEHDEYARYDDHEADAAPAAEAFASHARAGTVPAGAPPSLIAGLGELARVL